MLFDVNGKTYNSEILFYRKFSLAMKDLFLTPGLKKETAEETSAVQVS